MAKVRGLHAQIEDLTFRDGSGQFIRVAPGLTSAPLLKRTIEGADSLELEVFDPDRVLLRDILWSQKWETELDDLKFRYAALSKQGKMLTATLEDRWVAMLREKEGPKSAVRSDKMTRALFIKQLVEEACGNGLKFYCPQLHRKQPIETKAQAKRAKEESEGQFGKGVGDVKHLKVKGQPATQKQKELGQRALEIADAGNAPEICMVAVIAALIDETGLGEAAPGNVLQAEGSGEGAAIGSAAEEISGFLFGKPNWTGVSAVEYANKHPEATYFEICQAVQKSGAGAASNGRANYGQFGSEAREWVEAFGGEGGSGADIDLSEPYEFVVKRKEDYWSAIKELAKEVNWRAFILGDTFFYMPEPELFRGEVKLAIDPQTPAIENIDFDFDSNLKVTEVTVEALASEWRVPPGGVVTLAGYGPASIGFGDAPGGAKEAVSDNRNAATGEGRARYIVASIEVPLDIDPAQRLLTARLKKPTKPLPEKPVKTKSVAIGVPGAAGNKTVERMLAAAYREAEKKLPYIWGGFDPNTGFDCSGGVSWVLDIGGFLQGRTDTQGLAAWGESGPGELITVYVKTTGDSHEEHAAIEIAGEVFESGGGSENSNPNGGWGKVEAGKVSSFLEQFDTKRHPKGY